MNLKKFGFWQKLDFWQKILILTKNWFLGKFWFLTKFEFLTKIWIFDENFDFYKNSGFSKKLDFRKKMNFWRKFWFLTKISICWQKFRFVDKNFDFRQKIYLHFFDNLPLSNLKLQLFAFYLFDIFRLNLKIRLWNSVFSSFCCHRPFVIFVHFLPHFCTDFLNRAQFYVFSRKKYFSKIYIFS